MIYVREFLRKWGPWMAVAVVGSFAIANAITESRWIYLALAIAPAFLYLSLRNPIIFPFGLYLILIPFNTLLAVSATGKGATLTMLLGVLTILSLAAKGLFEKRFRGSALDSVALSIVLFILYCALSLLWALDAASVVSYLRTLVGLLIFYIVAVTYRFRLEDYETLKRYILIGGVVAGVSAIYLYFSEQFYRVTTMRAGIFYAGREVSPNNLSFDLLFPISIAIQSMVSVGRSRKSRILFLLIFILLVFAVILTGSRKMMLAVGGIMLVNIFYSEKRMSIGLFFILGIACIYSFIPDTFFQRWGEAAETRGSGRLDIWTVGLMSLEKYWLFGAGLANFPLAYTEYANYAPNFMGLSRAAHNLYLEILVELGIAGFTLMAFMIWKHFRTLLTKRVATGDDHVMLMAVLVAMLIANFFGDFILEKSFWMLWTMIGIFRNLAYDKRIQARSQL